MLLARTAGAVYWAGRYLERAEDMARLVLVHGDSHVDLPVGQDVGWVPLLAVIGADDSWTGSSSEDEVVEYLLVDARNPSSVLASLGAARDGFRSARAVVPRLSWELCNDLWRDRADERQLVRTREGRGQWLRAVVSACQRLNGTLWGTMRRDDALAFARIGQHLERADFTCRVLGTRADSMAPEHPEDLYAGIRAMAVLQALGAYQPFRRGRPARSSAGSAPGFALQDEAFPRSVASCVSEVFEEVKCLPANEGVLASCAEASLHLSGASPERLSAIELRAFAEDMLSRPRHGARNSRRFVLPVTALRRDSVGAFAGGQSGGVRAPPVARGVSRGHQSPDDDVRCCAHDHLPLPGAGRALLQRSTPTSSDDVSPAVPGP